MLEAVLPFFCFALVLARRFCAATVAGTDGAGRIPVNCWSVAAGKKLAILLLNLWRPSWKSAQMSLREPHGSRQIGENGSLLNRR